MNSGNIEKVFKAYDVRGLFPGEINTGLAQRIGEAYAATNKPNKVVVGQDVRTSGAELKKSLVNGLVQSGVDVVDIGIITTDQLYFAVGQYGFDGGISVTASHNPGEYNGFKFSQAGGAPISSEGLLAIRDWSVSLKTNESSKHGQVSSLDILDDYAKHVLSYIDKASIKPLKLLVNANFGAVGRAMDKIADSLGIDMERLNWQEDGNFPKGPPNPLLLENRSETIDQIKKISPDFGVAWDADADRVFFFGGDGEFIPSCYIIALLSQELLAKHPGSKIIHDLTTAWVIDDVVAKAGGQSIANRTGHSFMKARMRQEDAIFGGESSGHFYFKDSFYADNGIVPFLIILEMVSSSGKSLKDLVAPLMSGYKVSGEINFKVADPQEALETVETELGSEGNIDKTDGLVISNDKWRFSVRPSNTEPLFRFNAEAYNQKTLDDLVMRVSSIIDT